MRGQWEIRAHGGVACWVRAPGVIRTDVEGSFCLAPAAIGSNDAPVSFRSQLPSSAGDRGTPTRSTGSGSTAAWLKGEKRLPRRGERGRGEAERHGNSTQKSRQIGRPATESGPTCQLM